MYTNKMPDLNYSKEVLITLASTGKEFERVNKELLFKLSDTFAKQTVHQIKNNKNSIKLNNSIN